MQFQYIRAAAGDVLGNFAPPVVGLQELEDSHQRSEILKVGLVDMYGDTLELLSTSPVKSFLLSPMQPQLVHVDLQILRNPEEKGICSIKRKYSSIRYGRTQIVKDENPLL